MTPAAAVNAMKIGEKVRYQGKPYIVVAVTFKRKISYTEFPDIHPYCTGEPFYSVDIMQNRHSVITCRPEDITEDGEGSTQ